MTVDPDLPNQLLSESDQIAAFDSFGKHPVLRNEDKKLYLSFRDAAIARERPRSLIECWHLRRAVDCIFEALRYERCSTALLAITERAAFTQVAEEFDLPAKANKPLSELVAGWFQDDKIRSLALGALAPFGFDEGVVNAIAMSMQCSQLSRLSEMRVRAEAQAIAHLREIESGREAAAKVLEASRPRAALPNCASVGHDQTSAPSP